MLDSFNSVCVWEWLPKRARKREWASVYLNNTKKCGNCPFWSNYLTGCTRSPIITSPIWVTKLLGGLKNLDMSSLSMKNMSNIISFIQKSRSANRWNVNWLLRTLLWCHKLKHLEFKTNVINKEKKTVIHAWCCVDWEAVLVLPNSSHIVFLPEYKIRSVTTVIIVMLLVWLSDNSNQACFSRSLIDF